MNIKATLVAATLALGFSVSASTAATLNVDVNGQLLGASDVDVDGVLYDVSFQDGTCISLFADCDEQSDFVFTTADSALLASAALLSQVFIDNSLGQFDSSPGLTRGCAAGVDSCFVFTPYSINSLSQVPNAFAFHTDDDVLTDGFFGSKINSNTNTGSVDSFTYAVWSVTTPVPLPAGGWLLLSGLVGLAAAGRWSKRVA
ncbi:MAG: VPLPA-CTERM sorting domain-containing protein [Roseobacter sp.]